VAFVQSELSYYKNCKKPAQQINSRAVADLAHRILLRTLMQSMIWCSVRRVHQDTQNHPSDRQGIWHFVEVSGMHHKDIQLKCLKKHRVQELTVSNSVIDQAFDQWRDHYC